MKPCWKDAGLTEVGAKRAEAALGSMLEAVELSKSECVAKAVLREALFRWYTLPQRTKKYRENYMKKNGMR
jgi:hypothetical protein